MKPVRLPAKETSKAENQRRNKERFERLPEA
jgi:hypothetical protein